MSNLESTKDKPLSLVDFTLDAIVIEVRYDFAYLFWDSAGAVWNKLKKSLPGNLVLGQANPASVNAVYKGVYEIAIEQERFAISSSHPDLKISEFVEILNTVFEILVTIIKIEKINRIGFRQIFAKEYNSMKKVGEAISKLPSITVPEKIASSYEHADIIPGYSLRVEDRTKGFLFNLRAMKRNVDLAIPPYLMKKISIDAESLTQTLFSFDVDFYTKTEIGVDQISMKDWVKQSLGTIERESVKFFQ